jgi:hypothetical protein
VWGSAWIDIILHLVVLILGHQCARATNWIQQGDKNQVNAQRKNGSGPSYTEFEYDVIRSQSSFVVDPCHTPLDLDGNVEWNAEVSPSSMSSFVVDPCLFPECASPPSSSGLTMNIQPYSREYRTFTPIMTCTYDQYRIHTFDNSLGYIGQNIRFNCNHSM